MRVQTRGQNWPIFWQIFQKIFKFKVYCHFGFSMKNLFKCMSTSKYEYLLGSSYILRKSSQDFNFCTLPVASAGADPWFFKRAGAQIKDWQNFGAYGGKGCLRGRCALQKQIKIVIFKVRLHDSVHSFCLGCPHKIRHPISAKNRGVRPPSKSTLSDRTEH